MSLFWTVDSDGERVHRLGAEWDGNKGAWWEWSRYENEADESAVALGTTWSSWGIGIEAGWHRWSWYDNKALDRVPYREQRITLTFGPWWLIIRRTRPVKP